MCLLFSPKIYVETLTSTVLGCDYVWRQSPPPSPLVLCNKILKTRCFINNINFFLTVVEDIKAKIKIAEVLCQRICLLLDSKIALMSGRLEGKGIKTAASHGRTDGRL